MAQVRRSQFRPREIGRGRGCVTPTDCESERHTFPGAADPSAALRISLADSRSAYASLTPAKQLKLSKIVTNRNCGPLATEARAHISGVPLSEWPMGWRESIR